MHDGNTLQTKVAERSKLLEELYVNADCTMHFKGYLMKKEMPRDAR
jgi:hypothetical protein